MAAHAMPPDSSRLATGLPSRQRFPKPLVNLGFLDHRRFNIDDYRADHKTLVVDDAGRDLYLV